MIFTLGSDINLLKLHKQSHNSDLPDYYKICTVPPTADVQQSLSH